MKQGESHKSGLDYCLKRFNRLNVAGGYVIPRDSVFRLYVPDYQGNNVAVINTETGQAEQLTDYYPYGQPINNGLGASVNPYKYGGKELLTANGYNASDFAARWLSHSLPGFQSPDPLAHETPWLSMYMYCGGDPINLIDPSGKRAYMMPGTGQWNHSSYFGRYMEYMIKSLGTDWKPMPWSGSLWDNDSGNSEGRVNAGLRIGNEILQDIKNNQIVDGKYVGDLILIGGHSHGGNVGLIASKIVFDGLNELYQNGDLEEMPPINVLLLNTPAIEGDDRYTLTDAQSSHINVIHVMAQWDMVAAGGRLLKGLKSLFNIFNAQSDCNIIYKDQYGMFEEFPIGLGNHMGTFPKNVQQWFQKMREQIKFSNEDETKE